MIEDLRYFVVPVLHSATSASDEFEAYHCRVVNKDYKELFNELLSAKDYKIFLKIVTSNKDALLYRRHEIFGNLALLKIDGHTYRPIPNGTIWP